jgi:hypothetical protein
MSPATHNHPTTTSYPDTTSYLDTLYTHFTEAQDANQPAMAPDPDRYTIIPASLKIVKVLIEELLSASGQQAAANAAAAAVASASFEDENDEEGWEDDDDTLDLSLGTTKHDLMSFIEGGQRQRDDETQKYLTEFFMRCAQENTANFQEWYNMLTEEEKAKLNEVANSAGQ